MQSIESLETLEVVSILSEDLQSSLVEHLQSEIAPHLRSDRSSYAKGRARCWLQEQPSLSKQWSSKPALRDERLWGWISRQFPKWGFEPDVGLVTRGPVAIRPHRDASYARWMAFMVNLGQEVRWSYRESYKSFRYSEPDESAEPVDLLIPQWAVIRFCCKNPHGVSAPISEDRWSINLWQFRR